MSKMIDVSVPLSASMPVWPGSMGLRVFSYRRLEKGDSANVSYLECDIHVGTHVDAPLHFVKGGASIDEIPLDVLCGRALVVALSQRNAIKADDLAALSIPEDTKRLLLKTPNSELWKAGRQDFDPGYVALSADGAKWIVERGIHLVGIDCLSVQPYGDKPETHEILLGAGVPIIEGLNLADVIPGWYELICLPVKLIGTEGAPARVVLRPLSDKKGE
jgi:arylformamidase